MFKTNFEFLLRLQFWKLNFLWPVPPHPLRWLEMHRWIFLTRRPQSSEGVWGNGQFEFCFYIMVTPGGGKIQLGFICFRKFVNMTFFSKIEFLFPNWFSQPRSFRWRNRSISARLRVFVFPLLVLRLFNNEFLQNKTTPKFKESCNAVTLWKTIIKRGDVEVFGFLLQLLHFSMIYTIT